MRTTTSTPRTTTAARADAAGFQLTPPEVLEPVPVEASGTAVPLSAAATGAVDEQVGRFVAALLAEDVDSEAFKARLASAYALGREEISMAASLVQARFVQRDFAGMESSPAYKAINEIRMQLDELNPGQGDDLLQPRKILGIIPVGNKLQAYFRKYQAAAPQLQARLQQLYAARDGLQRDVLDIEAARTRLWEAMQKLAGAIRFAEQLDAALSARVAALDVDDPRRAKALRQEVLYYARQNLQDMLTQRAVCVNGYLALDVLKMTGREMMTGCSRVASTGMSALAVAQTVARATGNQIQTMGMLQGMNKTIENLIGETGKAINAHVERTTEFSRNPLIGIEALKQMFDQTYQAMDAMDSFRAKALDVMGQNNAMLKEQIARGEEYMDKHRQDEARASATAGPARR